MKLVASVKTACLTLAGHVVLFQILWGIPMALLFIWLNYTDGTLSITQIARITLASGVGALGFALLFWYTVSRPLIKTRRSRTHTL